MEAYLPYRDTIGSLLGLLVVVKVAILTGGVGDDSL
jgi:hypothetical protein